MKKLQTIHFPERCLFFGAGLHRYHSPALFFLAFPFFLTLLIFIPSTRLLDDAKYFLIPFRAMSVLRLSFFYPFTTSFLCLLLGASAFWFRRSTTHPFTLISLKTVDDESPSPTPTPTPPPRHDYTEIAHETNKAYDFSITWA